MATFLGAANLLQGHADRIGTQVRIVLANANEQSLAFDHAGTTADAVQLMIRPEDVHLMVSPVPDHTNVLKGRVTHVHFLGDQLECSVDLGGAQIRVLTRPSDLIVEGLPVMLRVNPKRCAVFAA